MEKGKFTHNSGIYCFENIINNFKYIGQAQDLRVRINQHKRNLKNNTDNSTYLQNAWNKYGNENFIIYIIEECEIEKLSEREKFFIIILHSHCSESGYNLSWGGDCSLRGLHHSEETKRKMSESAKKLPPRSEEYRKNLSEGHKGQIFTEEQKRKISEAGKRRKNSPETRKKISDSNKGRIKSEETKKKISESKKGSPGTFTGRKHTEASKEKQANARRGKKASDEAKRKMSESRKGMVYTEERNKKISNSWTEERKKEVSEFMKSRPLEKESLKKISEKNRSTKKSKKSSSRFVGVNFNKSSNKWSARIMTDEGRIHLGVFETEVEAAMAYNEAALEFYGWKSKLNIFTDEEKSSIWKYQD